MSYKITDPEAGKEYEACSLTINFASAKAIAEGRQKIELRAGIEYYEKKFCDVKAINEKGYMSGADMYNIPALHLYDRGGRFEVNVTIKECGFFECNKKGLDAMRKLYDFHDFDNEKPPKGAWYFYFIIDKVINSRGLDKAKPYATK